jgi:hypothetical protein
MKEYRRLYDCKKLSGTATIILKTVSKTDSRGGHVEAVFSRDCDNKFECGVGTESLGSVSIDWSQCVYPIAQLVP